MATFSKKRKRAESISNAGVSLQLSSHEIPESGAAVPVLVSTPGVELPSSTSFQVYGKKRKTGGVEPGKTMVAGETPTVEFFSSFESETNTPGSRYVVALHDRATKTLRLFTPTSDGTVVPTPVHFLKHTVKSLKSLPSSLPSVLPYLEARNTLGETFGTKKAKAQIKQRERQKVDVDAVKGVVSHIVDAIDKGAEGLTTKEEAQDVANSTRLVPPFSDTATDPADVYPLHNIIPEAEWKALGPSISPVIALGTGSRAKERQAIFPFKHSSWVNDHIGRIVQTEGRGGLEGKHGKKNLRILYYISTLFWFRNIMQRGGIQGLEKEAIVEKLEGLPGVVLDGLLSRFTETTRASTKHVLTTATLTKLHTYMFALCLRVDNYAADSTVIAKDLSLSVAQTNQLFRSLGCKLSALSDRERARLGLPDSAKDTKRAVLNAPVVFPKPRVGKRK
ncbi:RPA49/POLR1E RNA polymerase subunit family protein [Pleurotus pulmonarius]